MHCTSLIRRTSIKCFLFMIVLCIQLPVFASLGLDTAEVEVLTPKMVSVVEKIPQIDHEKTRVLDYPGRYITVVHGDQVFDRVEMSNRDGTKTVRYTLDVLPKGITYQVVDHDNVSSRKELVIDRDQYNLEDYRYVTFSAVKFSDLIIDPVTFDLMTGKCVNVNVHQKGSKRQPFALEGGYPGRYVIFSHDRPANVILFGGRDRTKTRDYSLERPLPKGVTYQPFLYDEEQRIVPGGKLVIDREQYDLQDYYYVAFIEMEGTEVGWFTKIKFVTHSQMDSYETLARESECKETGKKIPNVLQMFMDNKSRLMKHAGEVMSLWRHHWFSYDNNVKKKNIRGIYLDSSSQLDTDKLKHLSVNNLADELYDELIVFLDQKIASIDISPFLYFSEVHRGLVVFCGVDTEDDTVRLYALDKIFTNGVTQNLDSSQDVVVQDQYSSWTRYWRLLEKGDSRAIAYTPSFSQGVTGIEGVFHSFTGYGRYYANRELR